MSDLMKSPSSSGLGHRPFKAKTRVRVPLGMPCPVIAALSLFLLFWIGVPFASHSALEVDVTQGSFRPYVMEVALDGGGGLGAAVKRIVLDDLCSSGVFKRSSLTLDVRPAAIQEALAGNRTDWSAWQAESKADFVLLLAVTVTGRAMVVRGKLFDLMRRKEVYSFTRTVQASENRHLAHKIADRCYKAATGQPGYFSTKITYVGGVGTGGHRSFCLGSIDSDGFGAKRHRCFNTLLKMPKVDHKGRLFYIRNQKRGKNQLFMWDAHAKREKVLKTPSEVFSVSPFGNTNLMLLSLRHRKRDKATGARLSYIGLLDWDQGTLRRLTIPANAIYVSPAGHNENPNIVFNANRQKVPWLYQVPTRGGNVTRFLGDSMHRFYSPTFSTNGKRLAFIRKSPDGYQVCTSSPSGEHLRVLTTLFWAETPAWSPLGTSAIVFSGRHSRRAPAQLYRLDLNSLKIYRLSTNDEAIEPLWTTSAVFP